MLAQKSLQVISESCQTRHPGRRGGGGASEGHRWHVGLEIGEILERHIFCHQCAVIIRRMDVCPPPQIYKVLPKVDFIKWLL